MTRLTVLLLGKLPPPVMGPAIATQILLRSSLAERCRLVHLNTNLHASLRTLGTLSVKRVARSLGVYARFAGLARRERPDVVLIPISQTTLGFLKDSVYILLSRLLGRTTLIQLRGSNLQNWLAASSAPTRAYVGAVLRRAQGVIVLGDRLRHLFEPYLPAERIYVVPNGGDYQLPAPDRVAERGGPVRVLYLANLIPAKGIEDVLLAAARLKEAGLTGFVVDVVGTWKVDAFRARCQAIVEAHGLPVTFHGPAYGADKMDRMARADVFTFTPRMPEGHPWVIVEALASGLPVVASDQGAIAESVRDGVNGFVVGSHAPQDIADRLRRLIEDPALRARMSEASRDLYAAEFTEQRMVDRLLAALHDVSRSGLGARTPEPAGPAPTRGPRPLARVDR